MKPAASRTRGAFLKRFILTSACALAAAAAQDATPQPPAAAPAQAQAPATPPPDLARRVARRATETRKLRDHYTYRQTVLVEELGSSGNATGQFRETREVVFSPEGTRDEKTLKTSSTLTRLKLTEEDFRDIREVQPFLFDSEQVWAYEARFKGEENLDGVDCWLLSVRPRQILAGQRLFDGLLWVDQQDYSIVRTFGKAVPDVRRFSGDENLFPRFTTLWEKVEGGYRFPVHTHAADTLDFRTGPLRMRMVIRFSDYKKFGAESTVRFEEPKP